jgi:pyruvyltransferase
MVSTCKKKLLSIGSVLIMARNNDVVWGTGMNAKRMDFKLYKFTELDVRALRGPMTREFLFDHFGIESPEVYGDPALLLPYFFPEFRRKSHPKYPYIIIPHYSEIELFPKSDYPNVVYPTELWSDVIRKILDSEFVISSSLHGVIVAEAYGIPARYLRITDHEPIFKYQDYYLGTQRPGFNYATSVEEALHMGGEPPFRCNLQELYDSFPFEYWPNANFRHPIFSKKRNEASF